MGNLARRVLSQELRAGRAEQGLWQSARPRWCCRVLPSGVWPRSSVLGMERALLAPALLAPALLPEQPCPAGPRRCAEPPREGAGRCWSANIPAPLPLSHCTCHPQLSYQQGFAACWELLPSLVFVWFWLRSTFQYVLSAVLPAFAFQAPNFLVNF